MSDDHVERSKPKRRSITFPAEVNKRGTGYYITVTKTYRSILGIEDGDVVDVTISLPDDPERSDVRHPS